MNLESLLRRVGPSVTERHPFPVALASGIVPRCR